MKIKTVVYFLLGALTVGILTTAWSVQKDSSPMVGIGGAPPTGAPDTQSRLRQNITSLLEEQSTLLSINLRNLFINTSESASSPQRLDQNITQLAEVIREYYGDEEAETFTRLWRNYTSYFIDYAVASKASQDEETLTALANVNQSKNELIVFLTSLNPYLNNESFEPYFTTYTDSFVNVVDSYRIENYGESYDTQINATQTANDLANAITNALIRQFPERLS